MVKNLEYISDTGSRHEWSWLFCDATFVVSYHYVDDFWSLQLVRQDGEGQLVDRDDGEELMQQFPVSEALAQADRKVPLLVNADKSENQQKVKLEGSESSR